MATFPTGIYWTRQSSGRTRYGLDTAIMADGKPHVQSYFAQGSAAFRVNHGLLTGAELDTVLSFLSDNIGVDFTLIEPLSGASYNGKLVGDVRYPFDGDQHYKVSWEFVGVSA